MEPFVEGESETTTVLKWIAVLLLFIVAMALTPLCLISKTIDNFVWRE